MQEVSGSIPLSSTKLVSQPIFNVKLWPVELCSIQPNETDHRTLDLTARLRLAPLAGSRLRPIADLHAASGQKSEKPNIDICSPSGNNMPLRRETAFSLRSLASE